MGEGGQREWYYGTLSLREEPSQMYFLARIYSGQPPSTVHALCAMPNQHTAPPPPRSHEIPPPSVIDVANSGNEAWQVLLEHAQSFPVNFEVSEVSLNNHMILAEAVVEVSFPMVQLPL